jgi:hypothetical protein
MPRIERVKRCLIPVACRHLDCFEVRVHLHRGRDAQTVDDLSNQRREPGWSRTHLIVRRMWPFLPWAYYTRSNTSPSIQDHSTYHSHTSTLTLLLSHQQLREPRLSFGSLSPPVKNYTSEHTTSVSPMRKTSRYPSLRTNDCTTPFSSRCNWPVGEGANRKSVILAGICAQILEVFGHA